VAQGTRCSNSLPRACVGRGRGDDGDGDTAAAGRSLLPIENRSKQTDPKGEPLRRLRENLALVQNKREELEEHEGHLRRAIETIESNASSSNHHHRRLRRHHHHHHHHQDASSGHSAHGSSTSGGTAQPRQGGEGGFPQTLPPAPLSSGSDVGGTVGGAEGMNGNARISL
jgi:hypothetical protein